VFVVIAHHFGHLSTPYSANVVAFAIMISEGGQPLSFLVAYTDIYRSKIVTKSPLTTSYSGITDFIPTRQHDRNSDQILPPIF
jgi:hypothetical protein